MWGDVNSVEESFTFDPSGFCRERDGGSEVPIDDFYSYQESVLILGSSEQLRGSPVLGRILLLALVSGVESYFRSMLSRIIAYCPLCRKFAADYPLTLGAVDFYAPSDIGLGLLENISFSSEGEIKKATRKLLGLEIREGSSLAAAIRQFELVSHFRHAAVHSRGDLNSRNVAALELPRRRGGHVLYLELAQLHAVAGICRSTVRAYNRFTYQEILARWVGNDLIKGSWRRDRERFSSLFRLHHSMSDKAGASDAYRAYQAFRREHGRLVAITKTANTTKSGVGRQKAVPLAERKPVR